MHNSVKIIGAGAIGLYLAGKLAQAGIETTVYDGKRDIRERAETASGILSKSGLGRLGMDYSEALVNELDGVVMHVNGKKLRVKADTAKAVVLDRGLLAQSLMNNAVDAGANVVLGKRLGKEEITEMMHENKVVVGADGAISTVANAAGFEPINEYVLTYKAEFDGAKVNDRNSAELFFSKDFAHRFFGWTVPYSDSVLEVGLGISSSAKRTSRSAYNDFVGKELGDVLKDGRCMGEHASTIPIARRRKTVMGNVLLVGDAAGQTKSTTGGGLIFGISCANVAAAAITAHVKNGEPLGKYERAWRSRYGLDLKMHDALHSYYSNFNGSFGFFLGMAETLGLDKFLSRYGDMDSPSLMVKRFFTRAL